MSLRDTLKRFPPLVRLVRTGRSLYRRTRTAHLLRSHPEGTCLRCCGVDVFCDFHDHTYAWYDGNTPYLQLDQTILEFLVRQVEGNIFLDVGAHFGFFTASLHHLLQKRSGSTVIALEPDARAFRCLEETTARCRTQEIKQVLLPLALADHDEEVLLYRDRDSCPHGYSTPGAEFVGRVQGISLDSLAQRYACDGRIALIKIDIEGAEPFLFSGGSQTLAKHQPVIFMEFCPMALQHLGTDPSQFYHQVCSQYHVQWMNYQTRSIQRANHDSYPLIEAVAHEAMTDLILSRSDLRLYE